MSKNLVSQDTNMSKSAAKRNQRRREVAARKNRKRMIRIISDIRMYRSTVRRQ